MATTHGTIIYSYMGLLIGLKYKLSTEKRDCSIIGGVGGLADNQPHRSDQCILVKNVWKLPPIIRSVDNPVG